MKPEEPATLGAKVDALRVEVAENNRNLHELRVARRRHRLALILTTIGLAMDLALSGLFIYQHVKQDCTNGRAMQFFAAEIRKVNGQIKGENQQLTGLHEMLGGSHAQVMQGFQDFTDGTATWIAQSRHYLRTIEHLLATHHC